MIYLDNAATTFPKPENVYEETFRFLKESAGNPGRGGHHFATASSQIVESTRRQVGRFFGVHDHRRVIFTYNCTDSVNMVLKGFVRSGDHVITTSLDHNSVTRPLEGLRTRKKVDVTRLPYDSVGRIDSDLFAGAIRSNTKLVILNHGSNVLGSVLNLQPFIEKGIPILLDAAQTAGRIRIDVRNDPVFLTCSAHKSLFGFPGLGILIVPEGLPVESWREGGSGTASETIDHPSELPMHLEAGTPNFMSIAALSHGIDFIEKEGMEKIHEKELKVAKMLFEFLQSDDRFQLYSNFAETNLAIVAFNIKNVAPDEVAAILDQRFGIAVRAGLHCAAVLHRHLGTLPEGCLRVSPGFFNTEEDMTQLIDSLKQVADGYGA